MRSLTFGVVGCFVFVGSCSVPSEHVHGSDVVAPPPIEDFYGAGRYVVMADDIDHYSLSLAAASKCGAVLGIEIPQIFTYSAQLSVECVEDFLQLPGIALELDRTMMIQANDIIASVAMPETMPQGAYRVGADVVWSDGYFGFGARVALIDTGVDCTHQEFLLLAQDGVVIDVEEGYSFDGYCSDENGHGTAVASVLAAAHDGVGVQGMAPEITMYSVKSFNANGVAYYSGIAAGIVWAVDAKNVDIVLLPFGGFYDSVVVRAAISYARSSGAVIVAAAGNTSEIMFPARDEGVIGVGAIDDGDFLWNMSAGGIGVDIVASGAYEYVSLPDNSYAYMSGTSLAAARIAGGLALVISRLPMLTPQAIDDFLVRTSDDLGEVGWDEYFGYGVMHIPSIIRMAEIGWKM